VLTPEEIAAAQGDELIRLQLRVIDAGYEETVKQTAVLEAQTAAQLNKKQQAFFDLYGLHLKARKDPAIITSTTGDAIVKDIALDAMMMTQEVWPLFKQAMAAMEVPPGVDWS
jgi:hypothetical protein